MKSNSGEVVLGLVIGIAIGAVLLYVKSGELAQQRANATGVAVSQWDVVTETPGKSTLTVLAPAAAGAGIGWLLEEVTGGDDDRANERNNTVNLTLDDGDVNITISGDQQNTSSTSTRTDTTTSTSSSTRNDGSYNQ